jgi:ubiquitin C-terminal hydrolase
MYLFFYSANTKKEPILYDLYGVINHHGSLYGGHYTAYCQNFLDKRWYEFNDSRVSQIGKNDVASAYSYVLFYRRREK